MGDRPQQQPPPLGPTGEFPPLRKFSEGTGKRSVDRGDRARKMLILAWSPTGLILGFLMGGKAMTSVYNPRGSRVPPKKQYSQAESLVARGRYEDAVTAFEMAAAENPEDPARAAPELARLAAERRGTPEGEWAASELQEVRRVITDGEGEH